MVDFIKVTNAGINPDIFLSNPHLTFTDRIDMKTGELIESGRSAKYKDMRFIISNKGITGLAGSLHKYHNEGIHNHDDFTLEDLRLVIKDLQNTFGIDPEATTLNNVEFGVNLEVPFNPDYFIDHLVTHNYSQFNSERGRNMNFSQVSYHQYHVKIYNKGLQFGLTQNIMRFEVKIVRMARLAQYDIHTLQDLLIPAKLQSVLKVLLKAFDEVLYYDEHIDMTSMSQQEKDLLRDGYNPKYWQDHHKSAGSNASKKFRRYQGLVRKYGNKEFNSIPHLIIAKWNSLLQDGRPVRDFTNFEEQSKGEDILDFTGPQVLLKNESGRDFTNISKKSTIKSCLSESKVDAIDNTSSYTLSISKDLVKSNESSRLCPVTGLDISMQKATSRFLSITGIKYYHDNNAEIFNQLQDRLTDTWAKEPLEKKIIEIAHSIRNSHHSKRIHTQKAIKRLCAIPSLFDNMDLVSLKKINIANQ